jgi:hypothetical protein
MIILLAIAVVVGIALLVGGLALVSLASLREDAAHSLSYRPAGPLQAAARRVLGFHGDAIGRRRGGRLGVRGYRGNDDSAEGSGDDDEYMVPGDLFTGDADVAADLPEVPYLVS